MPFGLSDNQMCSGWLLGCSEWLLGSCCVLSGWWGVDMSGWSLGQYYSIVGYSGWLVGCCYGVVDGC